MIKLPSILNSHMFSTATKLPSLCACIRVSRNRFTFGIILDNFVTVRMLPCLMGFNPIALRKAKIVYSFSLSGCNRVKMAFSLQNLTNLDPSYKKELDFGISFFFFWEGGEHLIAELI